MESGWVKNATASTSPDKEQPLIRSVISLKNKKRLREFEMVEDCFILDFDPYESYPLRHLLEIALRDFPHSRYQCARYPFSKTPHKTHCKLCHCYVCDIAAPCAEWSDHCDADHGPYSDWLYLRRKKRGQDYESDSDLDYVE
ncbi:uncharacterized protein LOC110726128 [Chenopodium quinoa]|uniref:uncharacterized protein LOC110726128 n=1 Tax=Chenopodium quinoa TaxID=63459 RepID=UPI000B7881DE|nr:uncharacterized protein LOC110726128 [Chenopodium quinoa]